MSSVPRKFNSQPFLWLAVAFTVGILIGTYTGVGAPAFIGGFTVAALTAVVFRSSIASTYLILLAAVLAGAALAVLENSMPLDGRVRWLYDTAAIRSGDPVEIEGVLTRDPEPLPDGAFLTIDVERILHRQLDRDVDGAVRLLLSSEPRTADGDHRLKYGSRVRIATALFREDQYLNPGVVPRREILDRQGIDATGSVKSRMLIEHLADESVFIPLAWIYAQRSYLIEELRSELAPESAGVMIASLLGNKYFLDKRVADLFREGGTFHVLIISGLHITFIGGLLLGILRVLTRDRWVQYLVTVSILWAYTMAVGAELPVVRAALMFTVLLLGYALYRPASLLNLLGACCVILLTWSPSHLFDPSLQLTLLSVSAIVAIAYPLITRLREIGTWMPSADRPFPPNVMAWMRTVLEQIYWRPELWAAEQSRQIWSAGLRKSASTGGPVLRKAKVFIFEGFIVSLIVQAAMLPLALIYFHRVSLASVPLNLWVGFWMAVESGFAVAALLVAKVSETLALPLFTVTDLLNQVLLSLPKIFAEGGIWSYRTPGFSGNLRAIYFIYLGVFAALAVAAHRWDPFRLDKSRLNALMASVLMLAASLGLTAMLFHPFTAPAADGRLTVHFLDVGQGDSALVVFPDGRTMLIDGGGRVGFDKAETDESKFVPDTSDVGELVVSPFLWDLGRERIDYVVATHADADHIQGLTDVVKNFEVAQAFVGQADTHDSDMAEFLSGLAMRDVPVRSLSRGEEMNISGVAVSVLSPDLSTPAAKENDRSVVLRIAHGTREFLFTGDVERAAEADLVAAYGERLRSDVIKVPHHGSRTSSTDALVLSVSPEIAVVPVGRRSRFGHPHPEVIDRWKNAGARIITTGENGTVTISTDGHDLRVSTFTGRSP